MFLSKEEYAANKDGLFLTTSRYSQRHCDPAECGGSSAFGGQFLNNKRHCERSEAISLVNTLLPNVQMRFNG